MSDCDHLWVSDNIWLPAADVAIAYQVSTKYVRKLAHRHRWRRIKVGRTVAYLLDDVDAWNDTRLSKVNR